MKVKSIFLIIITVFYFSTTFAQNDAEAQKILDELSIKTKEYKTINASFTVLYESQQDDYSSKSDGSVDIKGDKYRLKFMSTTILCDGSTIWSYLEEVNEVNISEPEPGNDDIFSNPSKIFTIYESDFKYRYLGEELKNGKSLHVIDLVPLELEENFARITLTIDKKLLQIHSARSTGKDGTSFEIIINDFNPNIDLDDSIFTFKEKDYPDVEVIDLR